MWNFPSFTFSQGLHGVYRRTAEFIAAAGRLLLEPYHPCWGTGAGGTTSAGTTVAEQRWNNDRKSPCLMVKYGKIH